MKKQNKEKTEKPKIHIASCSFGKDSMATILLALKHGEPLDRVVFSEVMFDRERGISGEIPCHIEWIYGTAIPRLESMGVKVDVVRSQKEDYKWFFTNQLRGGGITRVNITDSPLEGLASSITDAKSSLSMIISSSGATMTSCNMWALPLMSRSDLQGSRRVRYRCSPNMGIPK